MRTARRQNDRRYRGVMLLEVIVALGLLVFGLSMVGLKINSAYQIAQKNRLYTQAAMLVDSKLDEVESGVIQPDFMEQEVKGDFGILYPGYTWRVLINPTDIEGFYMAEIEIGYCESAIQGQIDDPKTLIDIEDPGTKILRTAYRLFPKPAEINIQEDFGITSEDMEAMLSDLSASDSVSDATGGNDMSGGGGGFAGGGGGMPGGGGGVNGGGPANGGGPPGGTFGPGGGGRRGGRGFVRGGGNGGPGGGGNSGGLPSGLPPGISREDLMSLLQTLMQMSDSGTFDPRMLQQLPDEQFLALAQLLESIGIGRGNMSNLKDMYTGQPTGGPPRMNRRGEARRGFGRAEGRNGQGGQQGGNQASNNGQNPPGASNDGANTGRGTGNRPNFGNRSSGSGRGGNFGNRGNTPSTPQNSNQANPNLRR